MQTISSRDIRAISAAISTRKPFRTYGALAASNYANSFGRLPVSYWPDIDKAVYVVQSYSTPIAWLDYYGHWTLPDEKYSVTTSRHQGIIRRAPPCRAPPCQRASRLHVTAKLAKTRGFVSTYETLLHAAPTTQQTNRRIQVTGETT